jgi:ribonuclease Z
LNCGEGVSLYLKMTIFAIDKIFLSHGHLDHISGLPLLISLRQLTKGDNLKPLSIYYPAKDRSISDIKTALDKILSRFISFPLEWIGISAGDCVELKKGRILEAFSAEHQADEPLGFRILESRKRLKPKLTGLQATQLAEIGSADKYDHYEAKLLCYSGDSMPLSPELYSEALILIHDSTFLSVKDRKAPLL